MFLVVGDSKFFSRVISDYLSKAEMYVDALPLRDIRAKGNFTFIDIVLLYIPLYSNIAIEALKFLYENGIKLLLLTYSNSLAEFVTNDLSKDEVLIDFNFTEDRLLSEITSLDSKDGGIRIILLKEHNESILTDREVEIIALLSLGHTQVQIAKMLYVAEKTIYNHVTEYKA